MRLCKNVHINGKSSPVGLLHYAIKIKEIHILLAFNEFAEKSFVKTS